jgi:hypothetical protein
MGSRKISLWLRGRKMLRTILIIAAAAIIGLGAGGCKKDPDQTGTEGEPNELTAKTQAQYEAEAEKEITAENMQAELEKLEMEINRELRSEERERWTSPRHPVPPEDDR